MEALSAAEKLECLEHEGQVGLESSTFFSQEGHGGGTTVINQVEQGRGTAISQDHGGITVIRLEAQNQQKLIAGDGDLSMHVTHGAHDMQVKHTVEQPSVE